MQHSLSAPAAPPLGYHKNCPSVHCQLRHGRDRDCRPHMKSPKCSRGKQSHRTGGRDAQIGWALGGTEAAAAHALRRQREPRKPDGDALLGALVGCPSHATPEACAHAGQLARAGGASQAENGEHGQPTQLPNQDIGLILRDDDAHTEGAAASARKPALGEFPLRKMSPRASAARNARTPPAPRFSRWLQAIPSPLRPRTVSQPKSGAGFFHRAKRRFVHGPAYVAKIRGESCSRDRLGKHGISACVASSASHRAAS